MHIVHLSPIRMTSFVRRTCSWVFGLALGVGVGHAEHQVDIQEKEARIWSCDFVSEAVHQPMRFNVVMPAGADPKSSNTRWPVIYFLHGRGRHESTLLKNEQTRARLLASSCIVVLPRGRDGWYVNSPVDANDRYADYVDEVIELAEQHFPVGRAPRLRAIAGWSMGGYGAVYTATRRKGDFAAVASIIGLLDFPRPIIGDMSQNYKVPPRFGDDPAIWQTLNPRVLLPALDGVPLFIAYADRAPEHQMNEVFIAEAKARGDAIQVRRQTGGHTFPMVEQALPYAMDFLEKTLDENRLRQ